MKVVRLENELKTVKDWIISTFARYVDSAVGSKRAMGASPEGKPPSKKPDVTASPGERSVDVTTTSVNAKTCLRDFLFTLEICYVYRVPNEKLLIMRRLAPKALFQADVLSQGKLTAASEPSQADGVESDTSTEAVPHRQIVSAPGPVASGTTEFSSTAGVSSTARVSSSATVSL